MYYIEILNAEGEPVVFSGPSADARFGRFEAVALASALDRTQSGGDSLGQSSLRKPWWSSAREGIRPALLTAVAAAIVISTAAVLAMVALGPGAIRNRVD